MTTPDGGEWVCPKHGPCTNPIIANGIVMMCNEFDEDTAGRCMWRPRWQVVVPEEKDR